MTVSVELIGIGVVLVSPIYGALWYLIIQATENKNNISEITRDVSELKKHYEDCRYCTTKQRI